MNSLDDMPTSKSMATEDERAVYKTLLESTRAIPWRIEWDSMRFTYIGPQIEDVLGWPQDSWVSVDDWVARIHELDRERVAGYCVAQSKSGVDHEADYRALASDGGYVWIRDVVHVVRNAEGEVVALTGFMFDISERKKSEQELKRLQQELEALSYVDGLTGVANRRRFDSVLDAEWDKALCSGEPLSLVMLDIDHFKEYNDRYGHLDGDDCLRRVARILQDLAGRPRDVVTRFGGEEFALVLPATDAISAQRMAEHCRQAVQAAGIAHGDSSAGPHLTVSVGVGTTIPVDGIRARDFVEQADRNLYRAKHAGRNRVESGAG